jgi:hypothetical protein
MECDNCHQSFEKVGKCSKCKTARYCSKECQNQDWHSHKTVCDKEEKMYSHIMKKLERAGVYRHVNGDTMDNHIQNIQKVSPQDALKNKDWTVDPVCNLTKPEFAFWKKIRR